MRRILLSPSSMSRLIGLVFLVAVWSEETRITPTIPTTFSKADPARRVCVFHLRGGSVDDPDSHVVSLTKSESGLDPQTGTMRPPQSEPPFSEEIELECPMHEMSHGTACNGVMFDVEAVDDDIFITGIKAAADDDKGHGQYEVLVCEKGPWLNADFERLRNRSDWRPLMRPKRLQLANNPLRELEDFSVELSFGNYSALPFDRDEDGGARGVLLRKGERKALYVHGRLPGAVVYRHPVRCLKWDFDEADANGLDAVWDEDMEQVLTWHYDPERSQCVQTENDGRLAVYAGATFWDSDPFSTWCPISERDEPDAISVGAFVGNITYRVATASTARTPTALHELY